MKKVFSFLMVWVTLCSLCLAGCGSEKAHTVQRREDMPKQLLVSDVTSIPVAMDDMTYQQRRQLCLDFFEVQLGFQWVPSMDVTDWITTNYKKGTYKELPASDIIGGIPYQSKGTGNLYRWLEYYDENTGIMDLEKAFAENGGYGEGAAIFDEEKDASGAITYKKYRSFQSLFNQCSLSAWWGWGRVVNSVDFGFTNAMTAYNGLIPVGCYDYGYEHEGKQYGKTDIQFWGEKNEKNPLGYDTDDVIWDWTNKNGLDAMYKCYAQMKPGDGVVNKGHVMMIKQVNLFTTNDGRIDYELSTVVCLEQIEAWHTKGKLGEKKLWQQGGLDRAYTFKSLQEDNYIPFTFVELLDPADEQDKKHLDYFETYRDQLNAGVSKYSVITPDETANGDGVEQSKVYSTLDKTEGSISYLEFRGMSVAANYAISDVFVTVTDKDGNQLLKNIHRADSAHLREVSMDAVKSTWEAGEDGKYLSLHDGVKELTNGDNTIEISLQISTGEKLTAFKGTLTN